jgi:elongation factor Ts
VKLLCETDFVAKNEEFVSLAHNIAMQIVALRPKWTQPSQIPAEIMEKEKEIYESEVDAKKPKEIKEKIINGKLEQFYVQNCLLKQPYIKDDSQTIEQLIAALVGKLGEKIELKEFVLFSI